jgi:hypothetical protein
MRYPRAAMGTYVSRLNESCYERNRTEARLERQGNLTAARALELSRLETLELAAVAPPPGRLALRSRIVRMKAGFDAALTREPPRALERRAARLQRELQGLDLLSCRDWAAVS